MEDRIAITPSPQLMESMRSLGYAPEIAVADVVDNSISAGARNVEIRADVSDAREWFWILDDGSGMTMSECVDAMRLGSRPAHLERASSDLGRFGLGLKTASFSQGRALTVLTRCQGQTTGLELDLDDFLTSSAWTVKRLSASEMTHVPGFSSFAELQNGTLVCWTKLDRLLDGVSSGSLGMAEVSDAVRDHLGLVFHRWIEPESPVRQSVKFVMNGRPIGARDPVFARIPAVESTPAEVISFDEYTFSVQAFTLPDRSKLAAHESVTEADLDSLFDNQGFYFYRQARLISGGGWAGLARRSDAAQYSRVRVDLANDADEAWQLDVMKGNIQIPARAKEHLRRYVAVGRRKSSRIISYKGRQVKTPGYVHAWIPVEERGGFWYKPNPEHPALQSVFEDLDPSQRRPVLTALENMGMLIPFADIRRRMSVEGEAPIMDQFEHLVETAVKILRVFDLEHADPDDALAVLASVEPFGERRDLEKIFVRAVMQAQEREEDQ